MIPVREDDKIARIREIEDKGWANHSPREIAEESILLAELCWEHKADWRTTIAGPFPTLIGQMIRALENVGVYIYPLKKGN